MLGVGSLGLSEGWAQVRPLNQNDPYNNNTYPNDPFATQDPFAPQNPLDTTGVDSLAPDEIEIPPDTRWIRPEAFFRHQEAAIPVKQNLGIIHLWDPLEREKGFAYNLGQIGKPYVLHQYGLSDRYFHRSHWWDPVKNRYNLYMLNPETEVLYADSKTPYVNIGFQQGPRQLQLSQVALSRNISPGWNFTLFHNRRQSEGTYNPFNTDHRSIYASMYYRSRNRRYHAFGAWTFNQLTDDIHGGEFRTNDDRYEFIEGVVQDDFDIDPDIFQKEQGRTLLGTARQTHISRNWQTNHYYQLLGVNDSITPVHSLTLNSQISYDLSNFMYSDSQIDTALLNRHLLTAYPTLDTGTTALREFYNTRQLKAYGGVSYTFDRGIRFHAEAQLGYDRLRFFKDVGEQSLNVFEQKGHASLDFQIGEATFDIRQRISNLYSPESRIGIKGKLYPIPSRRRQFRYVGRDSLSTDSTFVPVNIVQVDSTNRPNFKNSPLLLDATFQRNALNPSLFQSHFLPDTGNAFLANGALNNQRVSRLVLGAEWIPPVPFREGDTLLPGFARLEVFASVVNRLIYYDTEMQVRQAPDGESITWLGASLEFRARMLRKLYLQSRLNYQQGSTDASGDLGVYARNLPTFYGTTSLFYDNRNLPIADHVRLGVDIHYHTGYEGFSQDPVSGEFFPANYQVDAYIRAGAFLSIQVKRFHFFLRFSHLNEGLLRPGYYTTPLYPMQERMFTLGFNWTFFD